MSATPTGQRAAVATDRVSGSFRERSGGTVLGPATHGRYPCLRDACAGYRREVFPKALSRIGLRGWHLHAGALGSIYLCIALWIRAKTVDQEERGNAERRALFVGLWPPMFWLIGDALQLEERTPRRRRLPLR